jgi:hypothetical protein
MSDQDQRRWLHADEPLDARLGELLDAGRTERPSAAQLDALAKRLGPTFRGPGPGGGGGAGGVPVAAAPSWAAPLIAAAAILVLSGLWVLFGGRAQQPAARAAHGPPPVTLTTATPDAGAHAAVPTTQPATDAGPHEVSAPDAGRPRASARPPARSARDELALLEQAQLALREAPQRALAATDLHAQRFPQSQYAQERELLAIDALTRLHEDARARARAERFLARYPESPHTRRIRELLASTSNPNARIDGGAR